jgi:AmiR/NasT family two-component response regulator
MATTNCTPDAAFDQLVQQSQHENRKLREVAEGLVARYERP